VFHAGDACQAFLLLLDGEVRVQLTSEGGREVTLYRIGPGGSCILTTSCLLSHEHYPAEAIAESDVEAVAIPMNAFQEALETSQFFRQFVFDGFSSRLTNVIRKIEQIAFTGIDARLATLLLDLDDRGVETVTHQDLAVELGTAREVVSRHLKRFENAGWVRLGRGRITLTDREHLESMVAPAFGD
jgi:CRP/FNR family transcriptional regulator